MTMTLGCGRGIATAIFSDNGHSFLIRVYVFFKSGQQHMDFNFL